VAVLSAAQLALVIAGFALLVPSAAEWMREVAPSRALSAVPVIISGLLLMPAVTALRVAVANAWAVLLPGWVHLGPGRSGGIESLGQNLLSVMGSMVVHLLLLVLPVVAGGIVYWVLRGIAGAASYVPAALIATAVAGAELWFIVEWLGAVLARTDPAVVEAATAS
jgi:hypothetical protein